MREGDGAGPRDRFAAALTALRARVPQLTDESLARHASGVALAGGRRVPVDARRLGEWLRGRAVPRDFDAVRALLGAVEANAGRARQMNAGMPSTVAQWRRVWQAAVEGHTARPGTARGGDLVVGRPPRDAAALRVRPVLAAAIDEGLADPEVTQVLLTGAGGMGKTQLACAAFHRSRGSDTVRVWVPAGARASVVAGYARAWRALADIDGAAPGARAGDEETQADLFLGWLRDSTRPWLVVLDDANDVAALDGLWPQGPHGRSLVTTRRRDAALLRPSVRVVPVGTFSTPEALGYLRDRLSAGEPSPGTDAGLTALAAALGRYPLALSQAAAYLLDTGTPVAGYLRLLEDHEPLDALMPSSSPADAHRDTVANTWRLSAERAGELVPPGHATPLLELLSVLATGVPEPVPLSEAAGRLMAGGGDPASTPERLMALRAVHRLNLVEHSRIPAPGRVEMHAVVQRAVRESVPAARFGPLVVAAADALEQAWAGTALDPGTVALLHRNAEALLAHDGDHLYRHGLHPVLSRAVRDLVNSGQAGAVATAAAGLLDRAVPLLGPEHRDVLTLRLRQAQALGGAGSVAAARDLLDPLLADAHRVLGPADRVTLLVRTHRARFGYETDAAEPVVRRLAAVAADAAAALGPADPVTLQTRRYLAAYRGATGDPAGARDDCAVLLSDFDRLLGPDHAHTLNTLVELARWTAGAGDPATALKQFDRAVDRMGPLFGHGHADVLVARHHRACVLSETGHTGRAGAEFAALVEDASRALGPDHLFVLTVRADREYCAGLAGQPEAVSRLDALRADLERAFPPGHPGRLRIDRQLRDLRDRL
jgi:hypothetical protein